MRADREDADLLRMARSLRRFARGAYGEVGDDLVRRTLQSLGSQPVTLARDEPRATLFRTLVAMAGHEPAGSPAVPLHSTIDRKLRDGLAEMPLPERQALLLVSCEGFAPAEAAAILQLTPDSVETALAKARARLRDSLRLKVFILEDDPIETAALTELVSLFGHEVCGTEHRPEAAIEVAAALEPDVLIADLRLGNDWEGGLYAAAQIVRHRPLPLIFLTAYSGLYTKCSQQVQQIGNARILMKPLHSRALERMFSEMVREQLIA